MKKALKIGAAVLAFVLFALLLIILNGFTGNPISSYIAKTEITKYVSEAYPDMQYTMTDVIYNFKFSDYGVFIQSETSDDTKFRVAYAGGKIKDYYEYEVENKSTTFNRFDESFNKIIKDIIKKDYPYEASGYFGTLKGDGSAEVLELDMIFDPFNLPMSASVVIWTESEEISYEVLAQRLIKLDEIITANNIDIATYTVYLQKPAADGEKPGTAPSIGIHDFPKEKIAEPDLPRVLREYLANWEKENAGKK